MKLNYLHVLSLLLLHYKATGVLDVTWWTVFAPIIFLALGVVIGASVKAAKEL